MTHKFLSVVLAGMLTAGWVNEARAETLESAVSAAIMAHPAVMAAKAQRDGAAETVVEEKSRYYPTASASTSFGRIYADNTTTRGLSTVRGVGYSWYGDGRIAMNQTLYDWSTTSNKVGSAKSGYRVADWQFHNSRETIAYMTTQAYIQALRAQVMRKKAATHLTSMRDYKTRIETAVRDGGADESELSRAQDIVSLAENAMAQADADMAIAIAAYEEAVGRGPAGDLSDPSFDMTVLPDIIDDAVAMALSRHPQIAAAMEDANAAHYEKEAEESNLLPVLDAELSYYKKDQKDLIGGEGEDARAILRMNWDMSLGGAELAAQRRAAHRVNAAEFAVEDLSRTVERDVKVAWTSLHLATIQKGNELKRLEASRQTMATYREQYEGGQKKILDIMTAEAQVFSADQAFTNLRYRELEAAYALQSLLTGMTQTAELETD